MNRFHPFAVLFLVAMFVVGGSPTHQALSDQTGDESGSQKEKKSSEKNQVRPNLNSRSRKSIRKAIDWLVAAQNDDGSWGGNPGKPGDPAVTSTVCVALLAQGNTLTRGPQSKAFRKGVEYLTRQVEGRSAIRLMSSGTKLMQQKLGKFIHTFMTGILFGMIDGMDTRPLGDRNVRENLHDHLEDIASVVQNLQGPNGGWEMDTYSQALTNVSAWMALRTAHSSGVAVDVSMSKVFEYITARFSDLSDTGSSDPKGFYNVAALIRILEGMGRKNHTLTKKAMGRLMKMVETGQFGSYSFKAGEVGGEEYYAGMLITQGLYHSRRTHWNRWYPFIRDRLIDLQKSDGAWQGHHCITYRTFCTAVNVITLSIPKRMLPIIQK